MADIKAKDIAVAQSIASSDLILGSSINGTTANVLVETLENHTINTKTYQSLGGATVSAVLSNLSNSFEAFKTVKTIGDVRSLEPGFRYSGVSVTVPNNKIYLLWANHPWVNTPAYELGFSASNQTFYAQVYVQTSEHVASVELTPIIIGQPGRTYYLWVNRGSNAQNQIYIQYLDL